MNGKPNVLVLCTHNAARSQMAEAVLRRRAGDRFDVFSAGVEPGSLHPLAKRAMGEWGVDMSTHHAKDLREYLGNLSVKHLIIVCDGAAKKCPSVWPDVEQRHLWPFPDPSNAQGSDEQRLEAFRQTRDAIDARVTTWLAELDAKSTATAGA